MRTIVFFAGLMLLSPCVCADQGPLLVQKAKKEITLTGYTRSNTMLSVSSEVSGKVLRVNYDVGQIVGESPFFEIDPTFIDFQIRSTRQSLKRVGVTQKKLESRVAYLNREFVRIDKLHKGDRATEVKRDAAEEEWKQARFELDALALEQNILKTTLKELRERKHRHSIFAPKDWTVVAKNAEAGEVIGLNTRLARVADYRTLIVPLSVSGEELAAIQKLPRDFDVTLEGETIQASLNWVNPEFNEKTRKLSIELLLHHTGTARGGLRFSFPLETEAEGFLVPKAAVISRYDNPRVIIKSTGESVNVTVLGESGEYFAIAEDRQLRLRTELKPK